MLALLQFYNQNFMKKLVLLVIPLFGMNLFAQCVTISNCSSNITVNADSAACSAIVSFSSPTASYTCPALQDTVTFNYTGTLQSFIVPAGITSLHIEAMGAQGGSVTISCSASGGLGAKMTGDVAVNPGDTIRIMVGQQGNTNGADAGGGGGTFVVGPANTPLVIAGGGGGASNNIGSCGSNLNGINATITTSGTASANGLVAGGTAGNGGGASGGSGGGGGGFLTDGTPGSGFANNNGKSYLNGGIGGSGVNSDGGGYGGGGAGWFTGGNGGGGGGYSGGGTSGNQPYSGGGGGGSYNAGTNQVNTAGFQTGNGLAIISYVGDTTTYVNQISGLPSGSAFPVGVTTQMFVATDSVGNYDTCTFTVTVIDNQLPTFTNCAGNIVVTADSASCVAVVNFATPLAQDNCSAVAVSQTSGPVSGSAFALGNTTVIFTALDSAGNTAICTLDILVLDDTDPVITCPGNITSCTGTVTGIGASSNDACMAIPPTITYTLSGATTGSGSGDASASVFNPGVTQVLYTATDASSNTSTCSLSVTVLDCSGLELSLLENMQVFPNPTLGEVNITLGQVYNHVQIELSQTNGQVVRSVEFTNTANPVLQLNDLAAGIYFIKVTAGNETKIRRIIKN
jgi:hypothetical protein